MADGTGYATCAEPRQQYWDYTLQAHRSWTPGQKVAAQLTPYGDNPLGREGNKYFGNATWATFIGGPKFGPFWPTNMSLSLVLIRRKA